MAYRYVLITPAHNEAAFIEKTIRSVLAQTVLPLAWVIVSDGSTDGTDAIVERYQAGRDWLRLLKLPPRDDRNFASKARAFNEGYALVRDLPFDVVGNVDADISFPEDFMAFLLERFEAMPELGVAGTHYTEDGFHSFSDSYISDNHVNGQCQLFRRECFQSIGGYASVRGGGIDWIAVTTARMQGWQTRSFAERTFEHHRKMGTAGMSEIGARFHYGKKDYFLGGHVLWQMCRAGFQMTKKPYVIGGLCLLAGYAFGFATRQPRAVSRELMAFHRREQMARLKQLFRNRLAVGR
jgi:glycosyltransferase involved in cell wall biosynthesis